MNSVINNEHTIIIKNSRFICYIYKVDNIYEINKILTDTREKYYDATHCCYAYILDNIKKESDDGEPSGTAGIPMLQVLEKNNLNHVLCIVVRYFGKIKLGAGGLVRAYTKSVTETLKNNIITLVPGFKVLLAFNYDKVKSVDYLLKDSIVINKYFDNKITYEANVDNNLLNELKSVKDIEIKVLDNIYIAPNN